MKTKQNLATQFTLMILLILLVGQGTLYTWLLLYQKSHLEQDLRAEMTSIADQIASSAAAADSDQYSFEQSLTLVFTSGRVLSLRISDASGKVVLSRSAPSSTADDGAQSIFSPTWLFSIPAVNTIHVPRKRGGGSVEVSYSGKPVNDVMARFLVIPPAMQVVTFLVVISAIIRFFRKKVSTPIAGINAAFGRITEGDLAAEVPDMGDDEIGSIATGARFLVEKLSTTLSRVHSLSNDVVAALDQMTHALSVMRSATGEQTAAIDRVVPLITAANEQQRESVKSTDDLSRSAHDNTSSLLQMKSAAEEIAASTERLFSSAEGSYEMISTMSQATRRIADSSSEVFQAVEETSASVQEINASLASVRENAQKSSEVSSRVRLLLTERGTLAVADAIEAMEKIAEQVDHFARIIKRLDEQSKDIEKVLSVIREVTEKTNLLSLNASILASQAGEHGKGFAVVAGEIRALSDGATTSAKDIESIVKMIRTHVREAVEALQAGVKQVEEGKSLIFKSGEAMGETLEAAQQSARMTAMVEKSSEEQSTGLRQIQSAMENIRRMFEQVAKNAEDERRNAAVLLKNVGEVKEVAEVVRKGTVEHASGTRLISENLETGRDIVSRVHQAAQDQLRANDNIVSAVEQVKRTGLAAMHDMEELTKSFGRLREEVEALKNEMSVFRTRNAVPSAGKRGS